MPEPVQYRNKATQSGTWMLQYQTECRNADAQLWFLRMVIQIANEKYVEMSFCFLTNLS